MIVKMIRKTLKNKNGKEIKESINKNMGKLEDKYTNTIIVQNIQVICRISETRKNG